MVGDDLVDLGDPEACSGAQHPRFDTRVFAPEERAALAASPEAGRLRWMLWSAKEAAYKVARKLDPSVVFSPSRFVVCLAADSLRGRVAWPGGSARVQVHRVGGAVHATAQDGEGPWAALVRGLAPLRAGQDASQAARSLAVRRVAERLRVDPRAFRVLRRGRIPSLALPGGRALDLSLSHHGAFVAFACEIDDPSPAGGGR